MKDRMLVSALAAALALPLFPADEVSLATEGWSVFAPGETPVLTVVVSNRSDAAQAFALDLRTIDYFGATVRTETATMAVAAKGAAERKLSYPELTKPGFYCTVADWKAGAQAGTAEGSFVRVGPKPDRADILFGMTCYAPDPADLFVKMGVGTKGVIFPWSWLEDKKRPGTYDLSAKKRAVGAMRRAGIRVVGMLDASDKYAPKRLLKSVGRGEDPVADHEKYLEEVANYYRTLVETFRDEIDEWSVSCEINLHANIRPYMYERHIELVRLFSRVAKEVKPSVKVLSMSVSGADGRDTPRFRFTRGMMPRLADCIDGFAPDQYTDGYCFGGGYATMNSETSNLRPIMEAAIKVADDFKLPIVAIDERGPSFVCATPISSPLGRLAADMVARDFIILKTLPRVRHWLYYGMVNSNPKALVGWGAWQRGQPRQPVAAYAATARQMGGATFVKGLDVHADIPCWVFRKDGRVFATLWYNGPKPLPFRLAGRPLDVRDVLGNPLAADALALSSSPVYVAFADEAELERAVGEASFDVPCFSASLETMAADKTLLVLRNLGAKPVTVRAETFETEPARERPSALAAPVALAAKELRTIEMPYSAKRTKIVLRADRGGAVDVETEFRPTRVKRIAGWDGLDGADEVVLDDPVSQAPGYADLHAHGAYRDLDDLSARARFGYDDEALYLEFVVRDDVQANNSVLTRIYNGDSVQFAVDARHNGRMNLQEGHRGFDDDDYNFVVAEVQGQRITHCYVAATENRGRLLDKRAVEPEVVRDEAAKTTRYRLRLSFADLAPLKPEKGRLFGFSFLVWDFDPPETGGYYIQSTPGVAAPVNPAKYASFLFD